MLCQYFTAKLKRDKAWFVAGLLRNETHTVLDRCLDKTNCEFEFFVPTACVAHFLKVMQYLTGKELVFDLKEQPNRLA